MFLKMANQFMEEEDYDSASVSFRKAILSGNSDPFVWRNVAAFLEKIRSPEIGNVWETLAELEPNVPEHKIRQADAMLELGRTYQTSEILRKLPESVKETVGFHEVSANLAIAKRDYQVAAKHFEAWHRLEPQNQEVPFQLLVTKIYSSDPDVANPALEQLEQIAGSGGPSSAQAYRALIARSVQAGDTFDAVLFAGRLVDLPNPNGMVALDFQTYMPSPESGSYFLWDAGDGPTGDIVAFAREESATDVAGELTDMIQTQRAYTSNAKVIQTVDEMLQETTNIKR
jgi:tetratricopeptide (TPR) repeat protein